ncbi:MAG TPA: hypothetical protein VGO59_13400 [Verrucomicrobiae bacterium]|jgi:hypothetical protein
MPSTTAVEGLSVLHAEKPEASDLNLIKLAAFMGVPARGARMAEFGNAAGAGECVAVSARALCQCPEILRGGVPKQLFVYGFEPGSSHAQWASALSGGALESVQSCQKPDAQYAVSADARAFCGELSGLVFGPVNREDDVVFDRAAGAGRVSEYVQIGGRPSVAGVHNGSAFTLLAGSRHIVDIDESFEQGARLLDYFSRLAPALWFLRHAFGDRCWHGTHKEACFIVDDPLLRKRHGFLRYTALLEAMKQRAFSMSVAFIPWNCDRSDRQTVELFHRNSSRLTLSVHGCDHTRHEFGGEDGSSLLAKASVAQGRMARHQKLTGLPCDNVMVFPQGVFSSAGMAALKDAGYLAAVNSTPFSAENPPKALRVRDLMEPAVLSYGGFPLFIRHYPDGAAEFALDLLLGKPALIVQHHDYFKNGYKDLQAFIGQVNQVSPNLQWRGLEAIIRRACRWRQNADGSAGVRFYGHQAAIENESAERRRFVLSKAWNPNAALPSVTLNGKEAEPERTEDGFCVHVELAPGQALEISVSAPAVPSGAGLRFGTFSYRVKVFARRHLCEIRDNYVSPLRAFLRKTAS